VTGIYPTIRRRYGDGMSAVRKRESEPRRFSIRLPRPLWILLLTWPLEMDRIAVCRSGSGTWGLELRRKNMFTMDFHRLLTLTISMCCVAALAHAADPEHRDSSYFLEGELAGSLKSDRPLPLYDPDPQSLVNRVFAAFYIRASEIPGKRGGTPIRRIEGGDVIDFLAWPGSAYWSEPETCRRLSSLVDECLDNLPRLRPADPLRRAMLQRDLWAVFDFYAGRNIARDGDKATRDRRDEICRKLARLIHGLTLSPAEIESLPDTYATAIKSGKFASEHRFEPSLDYLPPRLLTDAEEWQEIDFFQPHENPTDFQSRNVTSHTRNYMGRSYFRIFYHFPGGRGALENYLKIIDKEGLDWQKSAQFGGARFLATAPQVPVGTEVVLMQLLITLDDQLRPVPTRIVESVQMRTFRNVDGKPEPPTNTGVGMNVSEYVLKRGLLFDGLKQGGLERTPDDKPIYRVIFQVPNAPDWGSGGRSLSLAQDCRRCHTAAGQVGGQTISSLVHGGGFDGGATLGVSHPLAAGTPSPRGSRAAMWKTRHETYRRLLESLGE